MRLHSERAEFSILAGSLNLVGNQLCSPSDALYLSYPNLNPSWHMTLFSAVELAPRDPILGLNEAFGADTRPDKVNLGVGVYYDANGHVPLLRAVREAEKARLEGQLPRGYLPIDGIALYDAAVQKLLFGAGSPLLAERRVVTAQALGGTGALKIGA